MSKILEVTKKEPKVVRIANGNYMGTLSGYNISVTIKDIEYSMKVEDGIRGSSKVMVTFVDGEGSYLMIDN